MTNILKDKTEFMRLKLCKKEVDNKECCIQTDIEKNLYSKI